MSNFCDAYHTILLHCTQNTRRGVGWRPVFGQFVCMYQRSFHQPMHRIYFTSHRETRRRHRCRHDRVTDREQRKTSKRKLIELHGAALRNAMPFTWEGVPSTLLLCSLRRYPIDHLFPESSQQQMHILHFASHRVTQRRFEDIAVDIQT